ncbi:DEAD/DEAH box helicase [Opitutus sp. ER46]|uniref:DEAD/DEAH box helicase n=1 Tax=Opitutus sp. ER46 TaxID=2161864 RepID=UPI000D30B2E3|nr:DEAD/DEAH box helicase [Opitutus sp. ER46]PTX92577.1 DEAD/DEAH box helicase [Opitutus sp. ER46]
MDKKPFAELGLSAESLKATEKMGFEEASPIQTAVIPVALTGRDVVGQSSTGSGKTAAFMLPAIERIEARKRVVQVLVLCPTRELAVQVAEETGRLAAFKPAIREVPIYGGQSYERQFRALAAGVQIVIGTPGRVMDHMERGTLPLDQLRVVVLDEADRMLDMGFREDIEKILSATPPERQLLFFSATMPRAIQELIKRYSRDPAWVKIEAVAQNAPAVEQFYFEVDRRSKIEALTRLIDVHDFRYGIIFCSTKVMVDDLDEQLHARGYAVDRLHGDITQAQRDRVMAKFRERKFEFLVATDVAARGLDVDDLEVVFNFDLPNDAEDYTHRIGRTGRAGRTGKAFTFVSGQEIYRLQGMIRFARLTIRRGSIPSLDEVAEARSNVLYETIRRTLEERNYRPHDALVDRLLDQGFASTDICSAVIHLLQVGETGGSGGPSGEGRTGQAVEKPASAPAPRWVESRKASTPPAKLTRRDESAPGAPAAAESARPAPSTSASAAEASAARGKKHKYERPARTGREAGMATLRLNVGGEHLVTPADIVGKIAGVCRLPGEVVGAMDIHDRHTLVDVAEEQAAYIAQKLAGIRLKNVPLQVERQQPAAGNA